MVSTRLRAFASASAAGLCAVAGSAGEAISNSVAISATRDLTARALLVDRKALSAAQLAGEVLDAHQILNDAFYTDVRPALAEWRESRGLPADPMKAYAASGYQEKIEAERVGGEQAGWGA